MPTHAPAPPDQAKIIRRIENGLRPRLVIKGEPLTPMRLADRMAHYQTPGVSIAFINHGAIEWVRTYGVHNADSQSPVTPDTLFQAGSISKPVTAMAALALVEQGQLSLDEDVNQKLVSWKIPENEYTQQNKVTLRHLLSHTAGVTNHSVGSYSADARLPTLLEALEAKDPATSQPVRVDYRPGSRWRYSGGGYSVVQQLLIDVTGQPFPELMQELILQPLGMAQSTFEQPLLKPDWDTAASGHDYAGQVVEGRWHVFPEMAAAGLWATASDLALFAIELQTAWMGKSNKVISMEMAHRMLSPQLENCGLGVFVAGEGRAARFGHGGDTDGYKCEMVMFLESGQGAVIMTNADRGSALSEEILRSLAHEYGWPDFQPEERVVTAVDPKTYGDSAGNYAFDFVPGILAVITVEEGRLMMEIVQPIGRSKAELLPEGERRFFSRASGARVTFIPDAAGHSPGLIIHQSDGEFRAHKNN